MTDFRSLLIALPGIVAGLTIHECAHAAMSSALGDDTAKEMGRLSVNPLRHIDPIGFLFLLFAGFGWARPVIFNPNRLRSPRRDKALIAAAGPLSNLAFAVVLCLAIRGIIHAPLRGTSFIYGLFNVLLQAAAINLGLFIFNLIPIPPLDGSHIVFSGLNLKPSTQSIIMKIGAPLLFIVLILENFAHIDILPIGRLASAILRMLIPELG